MVKNLASGYRGYANMANLLIFWWSQLVGIEINTQNTTAFKVVEEQMKKLVKLNFEPKKADSIFSISSSGTNASISSPPPWLEQLIEHPQWKKMLYELSLLDSNKNCLLLNFAIQKITDAGTNNETAVSGDKSSLDTKQTNQIILDNKLPHSSQTNEFPTSSPLNNSLKDHVTGNSGKSTSGINNSIGITEQISIGGASNYAMTNIVVFNKLITTFISKIIYLDDFMLPSLLSEFKVLTFV